MTDQSVDRGAIAVWRWEAVFAGAVVLIPFAVFMSTSRLPALLTVPSLLVLMAVIVTLIAWHPAAKYRHLAYRIDAAGIVIREGIFWREESSLARIRIQHSDVSQGPLQRHYGVATLKLYTAGSRFTKIELPGLSHDAAIALRDELQREGEGDAV